MTVPKPQNWVQSETTVQAEEGLHARPAIKVSRFARKFAAIIQVRIAGEEAWVDAKSVAKLMGLRAEGGKVIEMRASGDDAEAALAGLGSFFEHDFTDRGEGNG